MCCTMCGIDFSKRSNQVGGLCVAFLLIAVVVLASVLATTVLGQSQTTVAASSQSRPTITPAVPPSFCQHKTQVQPQLPPLAHHTSSNQESDIESNQGSSCASNQKSNAATNSICNKTPNCAPNRSPRPEYASGTNHLHPTICVC